VNRHLLIHRGIVVVRPEALVNLPELLLPIRPDAWGKFTDRLLKAVQSFELASYLVRLYCLISLVDQP
jgi:hypothetical protein